MQKIGKEVKIGLAVIGVLVAAFGFILVRRLSRPDDLPAPAASAKSSTTPAMNKPLASQDQPTVVSATENNRQADSSADAGPTSHSLFTSGRMAPNDSADASTEPRGSFMPANSAVGGNSTGDGGTKPASDIAASGSEKPPEPEHSMFTAHTSDAPSDASNGHSAFGSPPASSDPFRRKFGDMAPAAATASTSSAATPHHDTLASPSPSATASNAAADGHSSAQPTAASPSSAGSTVPPTAAPAAPVPSGVAQSAPSQSAVSPADPFQRSTAPADATSKLTAESAQSPTAPATSASVPPPPAAAPSEANPLRNPQDQLATSAAAPSATSPSNSVGGPANGANSDAAPSRFSSSDVAPPPVTASAINVPSQYANQQPDSSRAMPPSAAPTTDPTTTPLATSQPPATPAASQNAAPATDASHKPGQYVVQADDNYWTVSEKVYGTGGYFKAIYEHNRRQHSQSDHLQVGDVLDVPDVATLEQMYPDLCPKSSHDAQGASVSSASAPPGTRVYTVADGDTLYEIARRELGRANRWGEIYQLNRDQLGSDFGYLRPGTQLVIPSDSASASIARDPNGAMQR